MTSIATPPLAPIASSAPIAPVQSQLSQTLGQMIGQILNGTVLALLNDTTLRLQTPAGLLDVTADTPLPVGTPVAIAVQGSPQQPQIVIAPAAAGSLSPPARQTSTADEATSSQSSTNTTETVPTTAVSTNSSTADVANTSATDAAALTDQSSATARTAPTLTQAALSTAAALVRDAATSQGSLATLYADLEAVVSAPAPSLPAPVLDAAKLLLAMRFDVASGQNITAEDVATALTRAGVTTSAPEMNPSASATTPADLGTALLVLRQTLKNAVDQQADVKTASTQATPTAPQTSARTTAAMPTYRGLPNLPQAPALLPLLTAASAREQITHLLLQTGSGPQTASSPPNPETPQAPVRTNVPLPPYRGAPSVPQPPSPPSLSTAAPPREQAEHLLSQTDAAIARQTLLRIVSLPSDPTNNTQQSDNNSTRVMFEIPLATPQGTSVAPMTVERDGGNGNTPESLTAWRANFSIDLPAIGPVHVRIALVGERATVTLNAERAQSAELLAAGLPLLDAGLRSAQIEPGELRCFASSSGNPAASQHLHSAAPGMFLDQAS
jgi:Flagellar hook-length control protein FliK